MVIPLIVRLLTIIPYFQSTPSIIIFDYRKLIDPFKSISIDLQESMNYMVHKWNVYKRVIVPSRKYACPTCTILRMFLVNWVYLVTHDDRALNVFGYICWKWKRLKGARPCHFTEFPFSLFSLPIFLPPFLCLSRCVQLDHQLLSNKLCFRFVWQY